MTQAGDAQKNKRFRLAWICESSKLALVSYLSPLRARTKIISHSAVGSQV
jgi:hypothetical protein